MNLLIVEENEPMRRMLRSIVVDIADELHECADGAQALAAYAAYCPDWVLMDAKMRVVGGIVATREIINSFPGARVMIVSDYDDAEMHEAARAAGARAYVAKENLLDVRRILRAHSA